MIEFLYISAWPIVLLALAAALACWRNAQKITNAKRGIRRATALLCLAISAIMTTGLIGLLPSTLALVMLLGAFDGLLLSLIAREIIEAPGRGHP